MGCGPSVPAKESPQQNSSAEEAATNEQNSNKASDGFGDIVQIIDEIIDKIERSQDEVFANEVLHSKQKVEEIKQKVSKMSVGSIDDFDAIQRFKLLFVNESPEKFASLSKSFKREFLKFYEKNEYFALCRLSSLREEDESSDKTRRSNSAFPGFLNDVPLLSNIEIEDETELAKEEKPARDSALGGISDGLLSPQNSRIDADVPIQVVQEKEGRCLNAKDEELVSQLLKTERKQSTTKKPVAKTKLPANSQNQSSQVKSQRKPSTENSKVIASQTFIVEESKKTEVRKEESPLPPPPPPPPSCAEPEVAKKVESNEPAPNKLTQNENSNKQLVSVVNQEDHPQVSNQSVKVKGGKKSQNIQGNQIKEEPVDPSGDLMKSRPPSNKGISKSRPVSSNSRNASKRNLQQEGLMSKHSDSSTHIETPKSRPNSRASSIASQSRRSGKGMHHK